MDDQFKSLLHVHKFNHEYAKRLVNDLPEDRLEACSILLSAHDRFSALRTALTDASSILVSTPAPHRVRASLCFTWI